MHCFNHQDIDAVGVCKHCGKGLCPSCLTDLGYGLACRDSHEQAVENINIFITRSSQLRRVLLFVLTAFFAFMGLVFVVYGILGKSSFTTVMGLGQLACSAVFFVKRRAFGVAGPQTQ